MRYLPSELLISVFAHLDNKSLSRATSIYKSRAALRKNVFACRGPPFQWLSVGSNIRHSIPVRGIFLLTPKDCGRRL
jgi:hypothetical protein